MSIIVNNVIKGFSGTEIIKDISFEFEKGKTNLIIGQSGSGKSVLTKCIVGLYEVDSGEVIYGGENFSAMNKSERKKIRTQIGMLFQGSALFDSYSVEQNVMFPLTMFTDMSKEEMLERVNFCLKRVELENKNHLFPSEISGGMQKRVAIARAIALNPQYLFCDEPNSGLDPKTSIVIDNLIHDLTKEYDMTTVVITHDMNSVMEIGENILYIHEGENWWTGDNHSIVTTNNQEIGDFVYASEFMKQLRGKLI
tara:strand:- start:113 stop:871 length:759 start_codon:yes stop_codon:yes gene_type:complete